MSCNEWYSKKLNEGLKKKFKNTFKFSNNDIKKFILLLRKGFYPYEYMDNWENFNEKTLPKKDKFYSNLDAEDIAEADYKHGKIICKDFEITNLCEYHDLYLKNDVLILAYVLENVRKMCLQLYELGPVRFISVPELAWQVASKKKKSKIRTIILLILASYWWLKKKLEEKYIIQFIEMRELITNI